MINDNDNITVSLDIRCDKCNYFCEAIEEQDYTLIRCEKEECQHVNTKINFNKILTNKVWKNL